MTFDAFSDLVLFAVCAWLARGALPAGAGRAGIGVACMLIGSAALLGVFRFSSWTAAGEAVRGAHAFAALLAAVAGFPIWAFSLAHAGSPLARRLAGAWWLSFVAAGLGVAIVLLGFKAWQQLVPALCGLWLAATVVRRPSGPDRWRGAAGVVFLFGGFAAALLMPPDARLWGFVSRVQLLHYGLALALGLLCGPRLRHPHAAEPSPSPAPRR